MKPATRFEVKYRIPPRHAEEIRRWIPRYMEPDQFGEGGEACYSVHSLYLDSGDWSIYGDTINGAYARFKLRARCYKFTPEDDMFLEVKARQGEAMTKTRFRCSRAEARHILEGGIPHVGSKPELENFRNHVDQRHAYARLWVTYRRYAYVGGDRGLIRVTFDDQIAAAPATADLSEPTRWHLLPIVKDLVVLELKYSGSYPGWVAEMVRRFDLNRNSMSKYRHSVDLLRRIQGIGPLGEAPPLWRETTLSAAPSSGDSPVLLPSEPVPAAPLSSTGDAA